MPNRTSPTGSELFIVDNSDTDWKVLKYLHDWCQISKAVDIAKGYWKTKPSRLFGRNPIEFPKNLQLTDQEILNYG